MRNVPRTGQLGRTTALLTAAVLLASAAAGCSDASTAQESSSSTTVTSAPESTSSAPSSSAPAADDYFAVNGKRPEDVTGHILYWCWDTNFFGMVEKMNDVYPNVTFDFVNVPGNDYMMKLQSALVSGGEVPDILAMEISNVGKFYDLGICEDIAADPYHIDKDLIIPYLADIGTDNEGRFIGIPNTAAPGGLYYRRDLAKQYLGTDDPDEISKMVSTWDDFIATGQKVTEASSGAVSMISGIDSLIQPLTGQAALPWKDGNKLLVSENYLQTYELLKKISDAKISADIDYETPAWNASFAQGNVLCYLGACWYQSFVIENNDPDGSGRWGVASTPGGPYNWGGIWWGMYNGSKNKEAVAAWMRYELSPAGAQNKYELIHFYPGLSSAYEADYLYQPNEFFGGQNVTDYYIRTMEEMKVPRPMSDDATFTDSMRFFTKSLVKGQGTPEELLDKVEDDIISKIPEYVK